MNARIYGFSIHCWMANQNILYKFHIPINQFTWPIHLYYIILIRLISFTKFVYSKLLWLCLPQSWSWCNSWWWWNGWFSWASKFLNWWQPILHIIGKDAVGSALWRVQVTIAFAGVQWRLLLRLLLILWWLWMGRLWFGLSFRLWFRVLIIILCIARYRAETVTATVIMVSMIMKSVRSTLVW